MKNKTGIICLSLAVLTILCVALALWTQHRRTMLILASSGFMLIAFVAAGVKSSKYGVFAIIALIFCWLGDFLGPRNFTLGAAMFLIAHLGFIAAFWSHGISIKRSFYTLGVFLVVGIIALYWLYSSVPAGDRAIVFSYIVVITAMVVFAGGTKAGSGHLIIVLGAVIFYVSDIFVARWRFVSPSPENAFFCYPLYYTACVLLALSILAHRRE